MLELDDAAALELQIIENLQREDVHPLDEALGYQNLLKAHNSTQALLVNAVNRPATAPLDAKWDVPAIAKRVGKSASYVYQRLKLAALKAKPKAKKKAKKKAVQTSAKPKRRAHGSKKRKS